MQGGNTASVMGNKGGCRNNNGVKYAAICHRQSSALGYAGIVVGTAGFLLVCTRIIFGNAVAGMFRLSCMLEPRALSGTATRRMRARQP